MGIDKVKIAFIGAGATAREHVRAFAAHEETEIVGLCSRSLDKAEKLAQEFSIGCITSSASELYHKTKADVVVVAVTIPSTEEICLECFDNPWMVLIEKPLGIDLSSAQRIVEAAKQKKRQAFVAFNRRHFASTNWIKKSLSSCSGKTFFQVLGQEDVEAAVRDGHTPEIIENWMYANAIHLIDLIRYLAGSPVSKVVNVRPFRGNNKSLDIVAQIFFENGDSAIYQCVWNAQGPWSVTATTHGRRFEMKPLEQALYQERNDRQPVYMPSTAIDEDFKAGFFRQAEQMVRAARGGYFELPTVTDALESTMLTSQIFGMK